MRKYTLDNRQVIAPNASLLGGRRGVVKRGDCFLYGKYGNGLLARSLGRLASCDGDGIDCTGHVFAMVLASDGSSAYVRWVDPAEIMEVFDAPSRLAAFFFASELPYSSETLVRLMEYGTVCERFIDRAGERVEEWDREERRRRGERIASAMIADQK